MSRINPLLFAICTAIISALSLSRIALAADIDSRITSTRSYQNGITCLVEQPPKLIVKEPQPQCAFGIFNIPGVREAEEAEKVARSGNYLLAAQMISTSIDYYDSAGNNIKPKKPNMMLLGEKLDNSWLAKRAYYYRKCKKDALAIADLVRVVKDSRTRENVLAFASSELVEYKQYEVAEHALKQILLSSNTWRNPVNYYLLGVSQESQKKTDSAVDNYLEAAQLFLVDDENSAVQACLEKIRKLCPASDPRKNLRVSDVKLPRENIDKILALMNFVINSNNCFDIAKLKGYFGTAFGVDGRGYFYKVAPYDQLPALLSCGGKFAGTEPKELFFTLNRQQCNVLKSDLETLLGAKTPLPQTEKDKREDSFRYVVPSGILTIKRRRGVLGQLYYVHVKSEGSVSDWNPKEFVNTAEWIAVCEYARYEMPKHPPDDMKDVPMAYYKCVSVVKGPQIPIGIRIWYELKPSEKMQMSKCARFDETLLPRYGSKWILFVNDAIPHGGALRTNSGYKGRIQFNEDNWKMLTDEIERINR